MLQLTLPPNRAPEIQLYARAGGQPVGGRIPGTVVPDRVTLYNFDVSGVANGDYVLDIFNPWGRVMFRKSNTTYLLADEWWELDYLTDPARDPSKVFVNQDYGGPGALVYALDGIPIADATIEVFLYSDYVAGNRNGNYRINNSRQTVDGKWATAFYLDPEDYVLRYYRTGTAGPDEWKVVVTFNPNDIVITPLDPLQASAATLGGVRIPQIPTPPAVEPVTVTQHYSGENALVYQLDGKPVGGATILVFSADVYNSGNHLQGNAVAATEQDADGNWIRPLTLVPGRYILHCFKRNVAGPNSYNLVVE